MNKATTRILSLLLVAGMSGGLWVTQSLAQEDKKSADQQTPAKAEQSKKAPPKKQQKGPRGPLIWVEAEKVSAKPWVTNKVFTAQIKSAASITLASQESGVVQTIHAMPGQKVQKGDLLLELDAAVYQAEVAKLRTELVLSELEYERVKSVYDQTLTSKSELDKAKALVETSKASLDLGLATLDQYKIVAPFNGQVGINDIQLGQYVQAGDQVLPLSNTDILYVDFSLPGKYSEYIVLGSEVAVKVPDVRDSVMAEIIAIDNSFDAKTLTRKVRAQIPRNRDSLVLADGNAVKVTFSIDHNRDVIAIPKSAINYTSYGQSVYVIQEGRAKNTFVQVGGMAGDEVIMLDGLKEGDVVITAGLNKLYHGVPVRVRKPEAKPAVIAANSSAF